MARDEERAAPAARGRRAASVVLASVVLLSASGAAAAAEIHRCPQPDGTTRFQDRPCAAEPARPAAPAAEGDARGGGRAAAAPAQSAPAVTRSTAAVAPSAPPAPFARDGAGVTDTRADYVARNAARCRDGDRRACAAVTCERSGRLDSPACQEAVGYLRGAGWDLRPRTDLFDPARTSDEFTLTCRGGARRATLSRARGSDVYAWPAAPGDASAEPRAVPRAALPDVAREFCAPR